MSWSKEGINKVRDLLITKTRQRVIMKHGRKEWQSYLKPWIDDLTEDQEERKKLWEKWQ